MQSRSDLWKTYAADGTVPLQTVAVINGVEYSAVSAPVITSGLASDALSIGNCVSATLNLSILTEDTIPQAAEVVIKMRYTDGENPTEWLERGTFYISKRSTDYVTNLVTLQCYDSMLKASVEFPEELLSGTWPKDMETVVQDIAAQIGSEVDSRTVINSSGDSYTVPYPNNLTMQDVLGHIAAVHGGNFIITPQNKLRLVPLISAPEEDDLTDADATAVAAVLGTLTLGQTTTVTGISGTDENGNAFSSGTDDGYTITITSNPCFTQAVCDSLLARLSGVVWRSYEMTQAIYDPAAELGDYIAYADGGVRSILWEETATLNIAPRMSASAPSAGDLEDEYPYKSSIEKLTETVASNSKTIKATGEKVETIEGQITAKVWETDIETAIGNIAVGGRNLLIQSGMTDERRLTSSGNTYTSTYSSVTDYTEISADEVTYSVHCVYETESDCYFMLCFYDSDKAFISRPLMYTAATTESKTSWTVDVPTDAAYFRAALPTSIKNYVKLEKGNVATDWTPAPEDTESEITTINESYAELVLTMAGITSDVGTINTILVGDDDTTGLADLVNDSATTIDDLVTALSDSDGGYISVESLKSQIEQLPDEVAITISSSLASYEATQDGILTTLDEYATYFSFTIDGLRISDSDSDFALLLSSDRISFMESDSEVAYISDSMLYIYDANIVNSLQLGNFKWIPRESGNLSLVKVGDS